MMEVYDSFFSLIIDMIPKDLYKTGAGVGADDNDNKYYKHKKQPLTPNERKILSKARKDKAYGITNSADDDEEHSNSNSDDDDDSDDMDESVKSLSNKAVAATAKGKKAKTSTTAATVNLSSSSNDAASTYIASVMGERAADIDDLRERLQQRIQMMKQARTSKKHIGKPEAVKADRNTKGSKDNSSNTSSKKRKNISSSSSSNDDDIASQLTLSSSTGNSSSSSSNSSSSSSSSGDVLDVETNNITSSGNGDGRSNIGISGDSNVGKPGSKMRRLKRMLEEATKKRQRIETLKQGDSTDKHRANQEQWNEVLKVASGDKSNVLLDTSKIRKSIKRREQKKEKSSIEWHERKQLVADQQATRQEKREENIKKRHTPTDFNFLTNTTAAGGGGSGDTTTAAGGSSGGNAEGTSMKAIGRENRKGPHAQKRRPGFEGKKPNGFLNK